jgi:hypothetical protein
MMTPPRRLIEDKTVYVATSPTDRLMITAASEIEAKIELLDKLGYKIEQVEAFLLLDADSGDIMAKLSATSLETALDEVLSAAKWRISESMELLGGSLGDGFGDFEDE